MIIVAKFTFLEVMSQLLRFNHLFGSSQEYKGKVCIRIGPRKDITNEAEEKDSKFKKIDVRTYV